MSIEVNRLHHPVTALGPGTRAGIWVQGCSIGCRGCLSRDTWEPRAELRIEVEAVVEWVAGLPAAQVEGITISGGEPFDQPEGLLELLVGLDAWRRGGAREVDILCYSGYGLRRLERRHASVLARIDAVIVGPYLEGRPTDLIWRGSANQELVPLTPLGHALYEKHITDEPVEPPIQISIEDAAIRLIGVPRRGDMEALEGSLDRAGIELGASSWRP